LEYLCEDIPPSNYLQNGRLAGISVELLGTMWKRMGIAPQPIKVVPWARGYTTTLLEPGHVLFSMSRTPERESLFKWVGPIFTVKNVLLARADRKFRIRSLDDAKALRIGTIKGDVVESYLLDAGFDPARVDGVSSLAQDFAKLKLGRVDLLAHSESTLREFIRESRDDQNRYQVVLVLSSTPNYYAFHRGVPDDVVLRFQKALDASRPEHERLLRRYGLSR